MSFELDEAVRNPEVRLTVSVVHSVAALVLFIRRRREFPLSGLSVGLVTMLVSTMFFVMVSASIGFYLGRIPCAVIIVLDIPMMFLWGNISAARSWRAWFIYGYAGDKCEKLRNKGPGAQHAHTPGGDSHTWFSRNKRHFSDSRLVAYVMFATLLLELLTGVQWLATASDVTKFSTGKVVTSECGLEFILNIIMSFLGAVILLNFFTVYKIRNVKDGYHLRRDGYVSAACFVLIFPLRFTGLDDIRIRIAIMMLAHLNLFAVVTWKACFVLIFPLRFTGLDDIRIRIAIVMLAHLNLFAVVTWKVIESYRDVVEQYRQARQARQRKKRAKKRASTSTSSGSRASVSYAPSMIGKLSTVLQNEELENEFNEHLRSEFSVENMLFYKRTTAFAQQCLSEKGNWSTNERNCEAASIFSEFVARDGELQVNIPSHIYAAIVAEFNEALPGFDVAEFRLKGSVACNSARAVSAKAFEAATLCIYDLMERDTFVRFKMKLLKRASLSMPSEASAASPEPSINISRRNSRTITHSVYDRQRGVAGGFSSFAYSSPTATPEPSMNISRRNSRTLTHSVYDRQRGACSFAFFPHSSPTTTPEPSINVSRRNSRTLTHSAYDRQHGAAGFSSFAHSSPTTTPEPSINISRRNSRTLTHSVYDRQRGVAGGFSSFAHSSPTTTSVSPLQTQNSCNFHQQTQPNFADDAHAHRLDQAAAFPSPSQSVDYLDSSPQRV